MARASKIDVPALVMPESPYGSSDVHVIPDCPGEYVPGVAIAVTDLGMPADIDRADLEAIVERSGGRLEITTAKADEPDTTPDPTSPNNPDVQAAAEAEAAVEEPEQAETEETGEGE